MTIYVYCDCIQLAAAFDLLYLHVLLLLLFIQRFFSCFGIELYVPLIVAQVRCTEIYNGNSEIDYYKKKKVEQEMILEMLVERFQSIYHRFVSKAIVVVNISSTTHQFATLTPNGYAKND